MLCDVCASCGLVDVGLVASYKISPFGLDAIPEHPHEGTANFVELPCQRRIPFGPVRKPGFVRNISLLRKHCLIEPISVGLIREPRHEIEQLADGVRSSRVIEEILEPIHLRVFILRNEFLNLQVDQIPMPAVKNGRVRDRCHGVQAPEDKTAY